jgi:GntR family transcriptional repressor for pyruvate dehydrogenase complex
VEKSVCGYIISTGCKGNTGSIISKALDDLVRAEDLPTMIEADTQFHYSLIRATNNSFMITLMDSVTDVYRKWIDGMLTIASDETKHRLNEAHKKIALGVISCDYDMCMNAIDEHYDIVDGMGEL